MPKKGEHQTEEANEKNRQAHLGKPGFWRGRHLSEDTKKKISEAHKKLPYERKAARLDKHHESEIRQKISEKTKLAMSRPEIRKKFREGMAKRDKSYLKEVGRKVGKWNKGKQHSTDHKRKISESHKGLRPSIETREKLSEYAKHRPELHLKRMRESTWENPEYVRNIQKKFHSKTRPEHHLEMLLDRLFPGEFKYNGRGENCIAIGGLTPDFVNINNQNKVICLHGDYWHKDEDPIILIERYAKHGYSLLIIWEKELKNREAIIRKIIDFVGKDPYIYFE